jgi:murein DD-endopeptidase MepM/ murein hydrolase activator NlpD
MSTSVARRRGRRAAGMLGHPFGLGLALGIGLFAVLWIAGVLSEPRPTAPGEGTASPSDAAPTSGSDPRVEPTARALPPPADLVHPRVHEPGQPRPALSPAVEDTAFLRLRNLRFPVPGTDPRKLRDDFGDPRTGHAHEALDILAPRGTPVVAVDDGVVQKLFTSVRGGLTVYHFDPEGAYCYYYAHLDRYADGLREGQTIRQGDVIGYVGTTGNSPPQTPHLHFAIFKLGPEKQWWKGAALNPFPLWGRRGPARPQGS